MSSLLEILIKNKLENKIKLEDSLNTTLSILKDIQLQLQLQQQNQDQKQDQDQEQAQKQTQKTKQDSEQSQSDLDIITDVGKAKIEDANKIKNSGNSTVYVINHASDSKTDKEKKGKKEKKCVSTQLVTNGSFETGDLAGYMVNGTALVIPFNTNIPFDINPHEGENLAYLFPGSSITQNITSGFCDDKVYRLNVTLSSLNPFSSFPTNSRTEVSVQFLDSNENPIGTAQSFTAERFTQPVNGEGSWNYHQLLTDKAPDETKGAQIMIATDDDGAFGIFVDSLSLVLEN
ncbi:hypothetical protein ACFOUV_11280 [Oceanobacillus longus]|uniref:Uncharacterized protein n=1 Tax=Oceanobacillus longus TaxID=930120 RepID=A0ABV8H0C3_9BACI